MINFRKNSAPDDNSGNGKNDGGTPPTRTFFTIDILELKTSRMDPRKSRSGRDYQKRYESLKASIRNAGLRSTLTVTKYPDSSYYELFNGGNTRLKILLELYDEYLSDGKENQAKTIRFQEVLYQPYTDDIDVLVKNMADNEERINMTFIDKARAVFQIKTLYLHQHEEVKDISNNKLVGHIHKLGWTSIYQPTMNELTFAFEKLDQAIPLALNSGMGRPKIQQLRLWLSYVEKYITWLVETYQYDYRFETAEQLYLTTLAEYDDDIDPIDLDEFWNDYLFRLSTQLMQFDKSLKIEHIEFELKNIKEVGKVLDNVPEEELSRQLKETATVPHFTFPEPRKPRTTKPKASETDSGSIAGASGNTDGQSEIEEQTVVGPAPANKSPTSAPTLEETIANCRTQSIEVLDVFMQKYDFKQKLKHLISYGDLDGDLDNEFHDFVPYFTLDLSTDKHRQDMIEIILSAEWPDQYVALHLLHISVLYYQHDFSQDSFDDKEMSTYKNLMGIWEEFATKYTNYLGLCQTELVSHMPSQKEGLLKAHQLMQTHIEMIRLSNVAYAEDKEQGGE